MLQKDDSLSGANTFLKKLKKGVKKEKEKAIWKGNKRFQLNYYHYTPILYYCLFACLWKKKSQVSLKGKLVWMFSSVQLTWWMKFSSLTLMFPGAAIISADLFHFVKGRI